MHRVFFGSVVLAFGVLGLGAPACGSKLADESSDAGTDAAVGPEQPIGSPCDPTLSLPCVAGPPCYLVTCDTVSGLCVEAPVTGTCGSDEDSGFVFESDTGAGDVSVGTSGCETNAQCSNGNVCGFPIPIDSATNGCAATGLCLLPDPPMHTDGTVYTGCGCNGQAVAYVSANYAAEPVSSGVPCVLPSDAGNDAAPDASGSADASTADASSFDAALDSSAAADSSVVDSSAVDATGD